MKTVINREVECEQWLGEKYPLPDGAHLCRPEVCWSADRKLVYFTYAELMPRHWIDAVPRPLPLPDPKTLKFMCGGTLVKLKDGTEYWRQYYPFAYWSVKSEASIKGDHRPVFLNRDDEALVRTFLDFCDVEGWTNPLPPRAEFRITDGVYGRGYRPLYLKPTDWLIRETGAEVPRVISDEGLQRMRAA